MIVLPLVATVVSALFAAALFRQYLQRRRFAQLAWGVALAQFALATLAVAGGVSGGWDPTLYRVFYLFGALLNVPWLALGSIALLGKRTLTAATLVLVIVATVWGTVKLFGAPVDPSIIGASGIPTGREAWTADPSVRSLASLYSIPAWLVVVGIAAWSSARRGERRPPRERVRANWLIAVGVSVVAVGGFALARIGGAPAFSASLAIGVTIMFAGFLMASRAPRTAAAAAPSPAGPGIAAEGR